jgi:hypothetical protein
VSACVLHSAPRDHPGPSARFQVLAVFYTGAVAAAAFVLNNVFETAVRDPLWGWGDPFYPVYVAAIAGHLAVLSLVFWTGTPWVRTATPRQLAGSVLIGVAGVVPVGYLVHSALTPGRALLVAAVPPLATALYLVANRLPGIPREHPWDGRLQAASVATGVLVVLPLLLRLHAR